MQNKLSKFDKWVIFLFTASIIVMIIFHYLPPLEYLKYSYYRNNNPFKEETIPMWYIYTFYIIVPCILFGIVFILKDFTYKNVFLIVFFYLFTHSAITCTCEVLKILVGEKRPDFLARCKPLGGTCTGIKKEITEGKKSFPSGHTASAFGGSVFFIFTLHTFILKNSVNKFVNITITFLIGFVLLSLSSYVGYTRIIDNRHFLHDVIGGGIIGSTYAIVNYSIIEDKISNRRQEVERNPEV
ncbi:PAP2-like phosphatidic acid phosphatase [Tubulinosema ratisbonensis]|uniref:PAP2-like phosphatidic acid phosphatase n=1 Tax=Tubulinosema ratisbonensis TaxID=291195 RepID=A0A437AL79_9MICR|nr:PAP2-like phosphatidic acid phosphatase [Tubulinosema ratisbonensis]